MCQDTCILDKHCPHGSKCFQKKCVTSCEKSSSCQDSEYCHIDYKVCLGQCSKDADCFGGYKCEDGHCFKSCSKYGKCPATDQYCHR